MEISVVIPMYNSKDTIKNVIGSLLNQTYNKSMDVVVVNDGSSDGCDKIVEEMIFNNKTIHCIRLVNKANGGVSSARNRGIEEASGDWIAFLDSDDVWLPEKLQKQVDAILKNSEIKFIGTNRNGETYPFFKKSKQSLFTLNAKELLAKWYPHTSTALIHKELLDRTSLYDESRTHAEDCDFLLRMALHCDLHVLNQDLVYTGGGKRSFGESGLSANMPKMYQGEILALKGAKARCQVGFLSYLFFYSWLSLKYMRRKFIVEFSK